MSYVLQFIAALVGTASFAIIYEVQTDIYLPCGLLGAFGWLIYLGMYEFLGANESVSVFAAAFFVICTSRYLGIRRKCPATMFLIPGIFPLVPGVRIFETFDAYMRNDISGIGEDGRATTSIALAIVIAIILAFEIPQSVFDCIAKRPGKDKSKKQ